MNTNFLESETTKLSTGDKRKLRDFLAFLHWSERPFRDVVILFQEIERFYTPPPYRKTGLRTDLFYYGCILRGALIDLHFSGLTKAWLRIAGACR